MLPQLVRNRRERTRNSTGKSRDFFFLFNRRTARRARPASAAKADYKADGVVARTDDRVRVGFLDDGATSKPSPSPRSR